MHKWMLDPLAILSFKGSFDDSIHLPSRYGSEHRSTENAHMSGANPTMGDVLLAIFVYSITYYLLYTRVYYKNLIKE